MNVEILVIFVKVFVLTRVPKYGTISNESKAIKTEKNPAKIFGENFKNNSANNLSE